MVLHLDPGRVAPAPWRNGAGATRELAAEHDDLGRLRWRVSVAELAADAPFSRFPGLDRLFVPLAPVELTIDGTTRTIAAGEEVRFPGEAVVAVALAAPTRAVNVMVRRGAARAEARLRPANQPSETAAAAVIALGTVAADVLLTNA